MQVVAIIPARYRSSRFPGKPLADIDGKPMIQRVYERTRLCRKLDRVTVATDDPRIARAVASFGGEALITRSDHESGTDRIAEAADILQIDQDSIIVNVQGDEPLLEPVMIGQLVDTLHSFPDCPMATLAFASSNRRQYADPNVVKVVVDHCGKALYFSRSSLPCYRDGRPEPFSFFKHLGFYAYRRDFLRTFTQLPQSSLELAEKLEQLRALEYGFAIQVAVSATDSRGIDTPEDLQALLYEKSGVAGRPSRKISSRLNSRILTDH